WSSSNFALRYCDKERAEPTPGKALSVLHGNRLLCRSWSRRRRSHKRARLEHKNQGKRKEQQGQNREKGGEKRDISANRRKNLRLDKIDAERKPGKNDRSSWKPGQVYQNDLEKWQKADCMAKADVRAPIGLPGEEAEADEKHLNENGCRKQPGNDQIDDASPFNHESSP